MNFHESDMIYDNTERGLLQTSPIRNYCLFVFLERRCRGTPRSDSDLLVFNNVLVRAATMTKLFSFIQNIVLTCTYTRYDANVQITKMSDNSTYERNIDTAIQTIYL